MSFWFPQLALNENVYKTDLAKDFLINFADVDGDAKYMLILVTFLLFIIIISYILLYFIYLFIY